MAPRGETWAAESGVSKSEASKPRARKRRRTAGGAGEDCWTCKRRAVACDRKRPYCTQCIEIGRECSGYKTTLSWGVGVASRGKLRGLACPVANKNIDGSDVSPKGETASSKSDAARHRRTSSVAKPKARDRLDSMSVSSRTGDSDSGQSSTVSSQPTSTPRQYASITSAPVTQQQPMAMEYTSHRDGTGMIQEIRDENVSTDAFPKQELYSPSHYQQPISPGFPLYKQLPPLVTFVPGTSQQSTNTMTAISSHPSLADDRSAVSDHSYHQPMFEMDDPILTSAASYQPFSYSPLASSVPYDETDDWEDQKHQQQLVASDMHFGSPFFQMSPRMQALMEHYNRHVCPYLVAFDGERNPYRQNILQLAIGNEGLQNAIAALASNNLRMRKKERRSVGFVTELSDLGLSPTISNTPNEVLAEESCYKQMAIDQLNMQLLDRRAPEDDSVLATLLILCLYHVCDSGFSKFRTQLAGVQKVLARRNPSTHSEFTQWVQMFFTWFDVMTSSVNDREMEIKVDALSDFATNLGNMEQFSGCDGRLFKLIARLGRLNLLAQGRPVKPIHSGRPIQTDASSSGSSSIGPSPIYPIPTKKRRPGPITSLAIADYNNIDGNGWGTPIISSDSDEEAQSGDERHPGLSTSSDGRDEFWAEWHEMRNRLHDFTTDSQRISPATSPNIPLNPDKLQADQRDLVHINESFRCAALLYTERLGHPHRPSSHPSFQLLVTEALYHIESLPLDSCVHKFLLWPLFLIGTECVDEGHRNTIRTRCIEVQQESGFYNNLSTLDVLERVWAEARMGVYAGDAEERQARERESKPTRQAFRWRKAMDRVDGEYIVI